MMFQATQDDLRSGPHAEIRPMGKGLISVSHYAYEASGRGFRLAEVSRADFIDPAPGEIDALGALSDAGIKPVIISRF